MTEKDLLDNGYKDYSNSKTFKMFSPSADKFYQKRFTDEKGIKYFIDAYMYSIDGNKSFEFAIHPGTGKLSFEILLYGQPKETTLEEVEQQMEHIWRSCNFDYYEV